MSKRILIVANHLNMFSHIQRRALSRVLLLPWLLMWTLTVPLFHLHALDIQENHFSSQPFLTHTVFTPDLPGEHSPRAPVQQRGMPGDQHALSSHFPLYFEIAINLFATDDTKRKIGISPSHYAHFASLRWSPPDIVRYVLPEFRSPPFPLLASSVSPRAPPAASC